MWKLLNKCLKLKNRPITLTTTSNASHKTHAKFWWRLSSTCTKCQLRKTLCSSISTSCQYSMTCQNKNENSKQSPCRWVWVTWAAHATWTLCCKSWTLSRLSEILSCNHRMKLHSSRSLSSYLHTFTTHNDRTIFQRNCSKPLSLPSRKAYNRILLSFWTFLLTSLIIVWRTHLRTTSLRKYSKAHRLPRWSVMHVGKNDNVRKHSLPTVFKFRASTILTLLYKAWTLARSSPIVPASTAVSVLTLQNVP